MSRHVTGRFNPGSKRGPTAIPPQRVRIIGGVWKRTPIEVAQAPGLRPTPDRVRETLFNWLGQDLSGLDCLDLFAGTGALGFEAASRGARSVAMVELSRTPRQMIETLAARLQARTISVIESDARRALARFAQAGRRFDLVFLDPPFGQGWLERVLPELPVVLAPGARVYLESETAWSSGAGAFELERSGRAGQVHYHLLRYVPDAPAADPDQDP